MISGYSGATRLYPILGDPIAQAKSPAGLTQALRAAGHDAVVVPMRVAPDAVGGVLAALDRVDNVDGLIATVPHKFAAFRHAATSSDRARVLGTANLLRRRGDGGWHADMIDGLSLVQAVTEAGGRIAGGKALLAGAGGAGCAVGLALLEAGASDLAIHDSDASRRDRLIAVLHALHPGRVRAGSADPTGADLVVNATPSGMREDDTPPVLFERLTSDMFVADVVTAPEITPLLEAARSRGAPTSTGVAMFTASIGLMVDFFTRPQDDTR